MNLVEFLDSRNLLMFSCESIESLYGENFVRKLLERAVATNVRITTRSVRYLGQVRHSIKKSTGEVTWMEMVFSDSLFILDESEIRDTILHELAHVVDIIVRGETNHDPFWQTIAKTLGARPKANASGLPEEHMEYGAKYIWECKSVCGYKTYLYRKKKHPIDSYRCPRCKSDLIDTTKETKKKIAAKYS